MLKIKYLIQDPELANDGPEVSNLDKSDSKANPLKHSAVIQCILETCVSSSMPRANLPSTLANMVFYIERLPRASSLCHLRGLVQALLLNR